jgi:hypothetical protein
VSTAQCIHVFPCLLLILWFRKDLNRLSDSLLYS